jgi:geranylgeranyl transferase type-2 subunit alpha
LTTRILIENPEFYTAWNYRREVLSAQMSLLDKEQVQNLLQEDIPLIDSLLKRVPKSYWVWNHRRWVLENCPKPLWETELNILNYMLDLDARNFHGWDYRRYVVSKSRISTPKQEFEYTTRKIHQNFSNFSAWHYRSKVMQSAFPDNDSYHAQIKSDVELVRNAIFTEPRDQSAWLYQRYLFRKGKLLNLN